MLQLKPGVKITNLVPQLVLGIMVVDGVFSKYKALCTVTSCDDSKHGLKGPTYHGKGRACDFRTKNFMGSKHSLVAEIQYALGSDFDVVLENLGEDNEHLHVEYDPK